MHARKVRGDNHSLIAFLEHASSIEEQSEGREIGENRVGESYSRDGIELPSAEWLATGLRSN